MQLSFKYHLSLAFLCLLMAGMPAQAAPGQAHYAVERPESHAQAQARYQAALSEAEAAAKANDMQAVHRISYEMEAAIAVLNPDNPALADAVEQMHLASEKRQSAAVESALKAIRALSQPID